MRQSLEVAGKKENRVDREVEEGNRGLHLSRENRKSKNSRGMHNKVCSDLLLIKSYYIKNFREDYLVEAMEVVEMYCDLLLARFGLVSQMKELDEGIAEAVSSIIWVAPRLQTDCQVVLLLRFP